MSRRERQIPEARIWGHEECAARLNKSVPWFYDHRARLEQLGMPKKDEMLGGWDSKAFEVWLDTRSLRKVGTVAEDAMLEAARGKN
jgi:hypothetical protein